MTDWRGILRDALLDFLVVGTATFVGVLALLAVFPPDSPRDLAELWFAWLLGAFTSGLGSLLKGLIGKARRR